VALHGDRRRGQKLDGPERGTARPPNSTAITVWPPNPADNVGRQHRRAKYDHHRWLRARQRDAWVAAFRDLVTRARECDECLHVAITADSVDPERIYTIEVAQEGRFQRRKAHP